jgi:hypothetical protein
VVVGVGGGGVGVELLKVFAICLFKGVCNNKQTASFGRGERRKKCDDSVGLALHRADVLEVGRQGNFAP